MTTATTDAWRQLADRLEQDREGLRLLGLYAAGPAVLGEPTAAGSDGDYVAVVGERPDERTVATLGELHADLRATGVRLGGAWAVRADLGSPMALGRRWWTVAPDCDEPRLDAAANTAVRRWVLRERGVALLGPAPATLVAPVPGPVLAAEGLGLARTRGEAVEDDPALLADPLARDGLVTELAVALHAAVEGAVVGPATSRTWCAGHLPDQAAALAPGAGPADVRRFVWEVHSRLGTLVASQE